MTWQNRYTGRRAKTYDADRCHSARWAREQLAVSDWVQSGPVLDCPVGTGRYCSIYQERSLQVVGADISPDMLAVALERYPALDARALSVFALPFGDQAFETAVCTRLLDWLTPDEMPTAVAELRRVARTLILTIRHGTPEWRVNQTHDLSEFYEAIDGLHIAERRKTEETRDGIEEIFLIRAPTWADVVKQFSHSGTVFMNGADEMQRLASEWDGKLWAGRAMTDEASVAITAEYWHMRDLWAVLERQAEINDSTALPNDKYITSMPPQRTDLPISLFRANENESCVALLDGRRRLNLWKSITARYPVLVMSPLKRLPSLGTADHRKARAGVHA